MVSRGLYYFDKVGLNDYSDFKYYLKAKPKTPLLIDAISDEIKNILQSTLIEQDIDETKYSFVNELL